MADETATETPSPANVDGRDAAGWHAQWLLLKQELDVLNPTLDAAKSKFDLADGQARRLASELSIAQGQIAALTAERDSLLAERDALNSALAAKQGELSELLESNQKLTALNQRHRDNITSCFNAIGPLHKALGDALAAE